MLETLMDLERWRALAGSGARAINLGRFTATWLRLRVQGLTAPELVYVYSRARLSPARNVTLGASCLIGNVYFYALAPVFVGAHAVINDGTFLCTASHDHSDADFPLVTKPIRVGDHAWVATNATVMPGVSIGKGAVVAAGAVVTKDVPDMTIVGGNPAREIGKRATVHGDWVTARLSSTDVLRRLRDVRSGTS
jgi:putative colanic acid biosynthesis acetyltransferase WcaF